jgi:hypothetical protein
MDVDLKGYDRATDMCVMCNRAFDSVCVLFEEQGEEVVQCRRPAITRYFAKVTLEDGANKTLGLGICAIHHGTFRRAVEQVTGVAPAAPLPILEDGDVRQPRNGSGDPRLYDTDDGEDRPALPPPDADSP